MIFHRRWGASLKTEDCATVKGSIQVRTLDFGRANFIVAATFCASPSFVSIMLPDFVGGLLVCPNPASESVKKCDTPDLLTFFVLVPTSKQS